MGSGRASGLGSLAHRIGTKFRHVTHTLGTKAQSVVKYGIKHAGEIADTAGKVSKIAGTVGNVAGTAAIAVAGTALNH